MIEPVVVVTVTLFAPFTVRLASWVTVLAPVRFRFPPVEATGPPIVKSLALTVMLPDAVDAFIVRALASVRATLFPLVMPTVLKSFAALVKVMSLPPAASVVVAATVTAPLCVRAPPVVTLRFPPTVEAPRSSALMSLSVTLFPLAIETAPMKSFALSSAMSLTPAAKVVVPVTIRFPLSVMAPPAVTLRLPPAVRVRVGRVTGAVLKVRVRLRRLVRPARAGTMAPALMLRSPTSRMLLCVPPNDTAPPKLLACV